MSKKIGFLQRWMFIIDKINAHPYITKKELELAVQEEVATYDGTSHIGTKSRTLERDLAEIRSSPYMDISIEFCPKNKGYYIPQNEKSLSKLDRLFELSSLLSFSSLKDVVFFESRQSRGLEYRFGLISAIRNSVEIIIDYGKYEHPALRQERRLQPYALREFKHRCYLLAREVNTKTNEITEIKIWGLDRIAGLTITRNTFQKDETLNLKDVFEHCFGIYANKDLKPEVVVLSFTPLSGEYIKSCPLHHTQQILIDDKDELRVQLTVKLTRDFIAELLTQSGEMRVITPQYLREELINTHRKAIELLKTDK